MPSSAAHDLPRPEYPRPQMARADWLNLNGQWQFEIDSADSGLERGLRERELAQTITVPFAPESELSGIGHTDFMEAVWYRRTVTIPAAWAGRRTLLHFGAADHDATVWVNGVEVARHRGGFSPFTADLADVARPGEDATIVVRVRDPARAPRPGASSPPGTATTSASTPARPGSGRRCGWSPSPTRTCAARASRRTSRPPPSPSSPRCPPTAPAPRSA
ncbi:sugar-binding domain-containing protein [Nonomuraea rubra]|uniref:sugar-binding domain-containing protein n=1 Tax=Nonomuraea rubra TaxID=46180 RepID=UPI00360CEC65